MQAQARQTPEWRQRDGHEIPPSAFFHDLAAVGQPYPGTGFMPVSSWIIQLNSMKVGRGEKKT